MLYLLILALHLRIKNRFVYILFIYMILSYALF